MSFDKNSLSNLEMLDTPWFAPYKKSILASSRSTTEILFEPSDTLSLRQSKLGGLPYLPRGSEYPHHIKGHPLVLLLQINFSEMPLLSNFR